jgi:hypothetical protein
MLVGFERASWLASYCSAQERLYKEYFADNNKYADLNDAFIKDLVELYSAILKFLIRAHKYFAKGAAGDCFSYNMCNVFHKFFSARAVDAVTGLSHSLEQLTQAFNERKSRMENYASLVHKISEHLLPVLIAESRLSMNFLCRRAPRFERRAPRFEERVGKAGIFFGICI